MEAAMTVVALFTLIMGIAEFGRIYSMYQNLTDAAREGARYAVAPDPTTETLPSVAAVQAQVNLVLNSLNISNGTVTVTPTTQTINGVVTTYSTVTVSAPYSFFFLHLGQVTLTADSEMRNETN